MELRRTLTSPTMGTTRPTRLTWTRSTRRGRERGRMITQKTKFRERRGESSLRQHLESRSRMASMVLLTMGTLGKRWRKSCWIRKERGEGERRNLQMEDRALQRVSVVNTVAELSSIQVR